MSWSIKSDPYLEFEYKMSKFCNAIGCEGHTNPLRLVECKYPKRYSVMPIMLF